jgi:hypothetical protein
MYEGRIKLSDDGGAWLPSVFTAIHSTSSLMD